MKSFFPPNFIEVHVHTCTHVIYTKLTESNYILQFRGMSLQNSSLIDDNSKRIYIQIFHDQNFDFMPFHYIRKD